LSDDAYEEELLYGFEKEAGETNEGKEGKQGVTESQV
jgi:hypothetical protein